MLSRFILVLLTTQVILLTGCSYLKYPNLHKVAILQGNILNQKMIDQLRPGLSRSQVRYILGTPLIASTFDQSRWDYFYSVKRAGYSEIREHISIYFVDDKLSHFTGDYLPTSVSATMAAKQTDQVEPSNSTSPEAFNIDSASLGSENLESQSLDSKTPNSETTNPLEASSPAIDTADADKAADKSEVESKNPNPAPTPEPPWEND